MSDPNSNSKISDPSTDSTKKSDKSQKRNKNRSQYQKKDDTTEPANDKKGKEAVNEKSDQDQLQDEKSTKTKTAKTDTQKQPATTPKKQKKQKQMSKEEQLLREQRKKIIEDINDYLNDQYNEPALRPIVDDNDVDDVNDNIDNDEEEEKVNDLEDDEDIIVVKPKSEKKKKQNILQPLMHSGVFVPPSITRQAISDALEEDEEEDDDQIKETVPYVQNDPLYDNQLPANGIDDSSSVSYMVLIMFMVIGSIYYVLREAIKRRQREEEPEKYDSGGDNLLGSGDGSGAANQVQKYLGDAQRMAERVAKGMLDQIENRYRVDDHNGGPHRGNPGPNRNDPNLGGVPFVPNEEPILGARPLESLASQSESILGSTGSNTDDPYANGVPGVIVKEKKKKSDKKNKEQQEVQDDDYDQA